VDRAIGGAARQREGERGFIIRFQQPLDRRTAWASEPNLELSAERARRLYQLIDLTGGRQDRGRIG
jgi:hypothetical protein